MPDQVQTCFSEAILAEISHLRAYARLMTNDVSSADREVTETLKRALSNIEGLCNRTGLRVQAFDDPQEYSRYRRGCAGQVESPVGDLRAPQSALSDRRQWTSRKARQPRNCSSPPQLWGPGSRRPTSRCESVSRGSGENHWLRAARIRRKSAEWLRAPGRTPSKANAHDLCRGSDCKLFWRCKCLPRILWDK